MGTTSRRRGGRQSGPWRVQRARGGSRRGRSPPQIRSQKRRSFFSRRGLLSQGPFEVGSRRPEQRQGLSVSVLGGGERRLLLQQDAEQDRLLRVGLRLVAKPFLLGFASAHGHGQLGPGFP